MILPDMFIHVSGTVSEALYPVNLDRKNKLTINYTYLIAQNIFLSPPSYFEKPHIKLPVVNMYAH